MTNIASAAISFFATEDGEIAKSDALKHNAQVADFNADTTHQQGIASDQALDRDIRATQGRMSAAYAGSGVDTSQGSPLTVLADSIRKGVLDRATNKWNFAMQESNYRSEAAADRLDARNVRHAAIVKATSASLASFNGGNGGTGSLGEPQGGTSGSNYMWSNGNSLTGGTYTGDQSMSTSWGGQGGGWGS